ncbi:MAG: hypothetical protein GX044_00815 [Firmicutes bacterium]|jgi:hypothetical protein|nr:hypothetical protein [Bacillota bacterium]
MMRQWRVGSFSMGLILVLLGIGLLIDHFSGAASMLEVMLRWWPAVLILLGLEIIAAGALNRNGQFVIKYDFFSMIIVFVFFIFTLGGYVLAESGLLPAIRDGLTAYEQTLSMRKTKIPLNGIAKVVLSYGDGELELHSTTGEHLEIFGQASLHTPAETTFTAADFGALETHRSGETLYIQLAPLPEQIGLFHYGARQIKRTVLVPADRFLIIEGSGVHENMQLRLDRLEAPWSIHCGGSVQALLSPELDVTLYSTTSHPHARESLKGNAPWEIAEPPVEGELEPASGTIQIGAGTWPLHINAGWDVTADLWP